MLIVLVLPNVGTCAFIVLVINTKPIKITFLRFIFIEGRIFEIVCCTKLTKLKLDCKSSSELLENEDCVRCINYLLCAICSTQKEAPNWGCKKRCLTM